MRSETSLSPFVYWAQSESNISLRVELSNVKSPSVLLNEDELEFSAIGVGAQGRNEYHFVLEFFLPVDPKASQYRVNDREVEFNITKVKNEWWPRLTVDQKKPIWLKIDFDRWKSEDDDEIDAQAIDEQLKEIFDPKKEEAMQDEAYAKIYLFMYNIFQWAGFTIILCMLLFYAIRDGAASFQRAYDNVGSLFIFFQSFQLFEILFAAFGWTKSKNIVVPALQIIGRVVILVLFIALEPRLHNKPVVFYLFLVWSVIEVVRYPFYILKVFDFELHFLTWLRYTIWIPLIPLGFLCEGVTILRNIPYYEETKRFSFHLPNNLNWSFDMPSLMRIYLLFLCFPTMFVMMSHMYRQRIRALGSKSQKQKSD